MSLGALEQAIALWQCGHPDAAHDVLLAASADPDWVRDLKKLHPSRDFMRMVSVGEDGRVKVVTPAEVPPKVTGAVTLDDPDLPQKQKTAFEALGAESREQYPDVCAKCGAPAGTGGCSLAIPMTSDVSHMVIGGPDGVGLNFATQCDELAEFTRLVTGS